MLTDVTAHTEKSLSAAILKTWGGVPSQGGGVRYVVALQVNNGAGFSFGRTLDAIVFDTWQSKGLTLDGFEIKVRKSDLRRELQDPSKSAGFTDHLDTFSIVAPKAVIDRDIIPKRWGIYVPDDKGTLRTIRKPLYLHDDSRDRTHVDRSIMAAFSRALVQRSLSREAEDLAYDRGYRNGEKSTQYKLDQATRSLAELAEAVAEFKDASGVEITAYRGREVGEAFEAFCRLSGKGWNCGLPIEDARRVVGRMESLAADLEVLKSYLSPDRDAQTSMAVAP